MRPGMQVTWRQLPSQITPVYDHTIVAYNGHVLSFGGHLCHNTKGQDDPFNYSNRLNRLDVREEVAALDRATCPQHTEL